MCLIIFFCTTVNQSVYCKFEAKPQCLLRCGAEVSTINLRVTATKSGHNTVNFMEYYSKYRLMKVTDGELKIYMVNLAVYNLLRSESVYASYFQTRANHQPSP